MKKPVTVIPNGTRVQHTDIYLLNLWGVGVATESWGVKERGRIVIKYHVQFSLEEDDIAMGLTPQDALITMTDEQTEVLQTP